MIEAAVIADSISPAGIRLTTFKLRYPKFIHGEFMTHRMLSRNASSSRAVPTSKLLEEVRSYDIMAKPVFWGKNQPGMQAAEELSAVEGHPDGARSERFQAERIWIAAAYSAAKYAEMLVKLGAHKQIVNRLLEPFSHINVVATATEWENFFGLRLHQDAQPEMRALAEKTWKVRAASLPIHLSLGEWHTPFVPFTEMCEAKVHEEHFGSGALRQVVYQSVARCARVSYESFETGKRSTVEEDLKLYDRLLSAQPLHASPAEHQATPDDMGLAASGRTQTWLCPNQHGNFHGWRQYRKMLPGESCAPLPDSYRG